MRTNYFTLVCLILTSCLFAQNNDFNNGGGDLLWSNSANWTLGVVPNTTNTGQVRLPLLLESQVDTDVTIKKIQNIFGTSGNVSVAGGATLTLDPGAANAYGIENVSNNDVNLSFIGNVNINNPAGFTLMRNLNGASNIIEFADGSTLTLTTNISTATGSNNAGFQFNGSLAGSGNLRFGANTTSTFGSTASNGSYLGELPFLTNAAVIVNTADNNVFYNGPKLQVNGNGASIEINGENVFASGVVIGGSNTFTFTANKNQSSMGTIVFSNDGTLNLVVDPSVTNLSFGDNSESAWGAGTLNVVGYSQGVIRFGTDNTGLTEDQLAQITDGSAESFALDDNGFLIYESKLSIDDFNTDGQSAILQVTVTRNTLNFNMPQSNVKIVDLRGRVVLNKTSQNLSEISIEFLSPGHYFAIFDDNVVERFIKK